MDHRIIPEEHISSVQSLSHVQLFATPWTAAFCGSLSITNSWSLLKLVSIDLVKNISFCFTDYAKVFDCVDYNKLWKILKEIGIPDHLTCLLRSLYAGQEATVRTRHGTWTGSIWERSSQGCILSSCWLNFYAEDIMQNAGTGWSTSWNQECWGKYQ